MTTSPVQEGLLLQENSGKKDYSQLAVSQTVQVNHLQEGSFPCILQTAL